MPNIQLKTAKLPKLLGDLMHSNQFLKVFSASALALSFFTLIFCFALATREPVVLAFSSDAKALEFTVLPKPEKEIEAAIRHYVTKRYKWEPSTVQAQLRTAEAFISPQSLSAFRQAAVHIIRFSTEKQASQRAFPEQVTVSFEKKIAQVSGDRVTAIQGMRAAGSLRLELSFESGPRTKENPWGIYITKEREEM